MELPVGTVAIVGADGTEGREELRALLDAEQARRKMAERRYAEALLPPPERPRQARCSEASHRAPVWVDMGV